MARRSRPRIEPGTKMGLHWSYDGSAAHHLSRLRRHSVGAGAALYQGEHYSRLCELADTMERAEAHTTDRSGLSRTANNEE